MRSRALGHKSLVLCERIAKHWNRHGDKEAHVAKDNQGFYFVTFNKNKRGGIYF